MKTTAFKTTALETREQLVLITGAAGNMGRMLREGLRSPLRLTDSVPDEDCLLASVNDLAAMRAVMRGVTAVVHLAGITEEDDWDRIIDVNLNGTRTVLEAARLEGVEQVVLASSNHAAGFQRKGDGDMPADAAARPDTYYGFSKAALESLAALYHERFGMNIVCLRIGTCYDKPDDIRGLSTWLSPSDAVRLVEASIEAEGLHTVWGVSDNTRRWWSLDEGKAIGYHPEDDAEVFAADLAGQVPDELGQRYVGGYFCELPLGERPSERVKTVLVGYGHAARNLHRAALDESNLDGVIEDILVVDPYCAPGTDVEIYKNLHDLPATSSSDVFHVTVPPADHAAVVEEIIALGAKRIIVEKPLATDGQSARRIVKACAEADVALYPVGVWPFSSGMRRLRQDLITRSMKPLHYEFEQSKNRIARTLENSSHTSAFDIELPHQLLAAIWLFGEITEVLHSESRPMVADGRELPHAGGVFVVVKHRDGTVGTHIGHLDKESRTRRLRVSCDNGDLEVTLPRSKEERSSFYRDATGRVAEFPDRPLTEFVRSAYRAGPADDQAVSLVDLHVHCIDILDLARRKAGVW